MIYRTALRRPPPKTTIGHSNITRLNEIYEMHRFDLNFESSTIEIGFQDELRDEPTELRDRPPAKGKALLAFTICLDLFCLKTSV